jgi:hypothetical protein
MTLHERYTSLRAWWYFHEKNPYYWKDDADTIWRIFQQIFCLKWGGVFIVFCVMGFAIFDSIIYYIWIWGMSLLLVICVILLGMIEKR